MCAAAFWRWLCRRALALVPLLALALPGQAPAMPWPQEEGHGILIMQATPYRATTRGYDPSGRIDGTGTFSRLELAAPYWEHGLTSRWTVGLQPRLQAAWLDERGSHRVNAGIADVAGFARYMVYKGRLDVFSLQALLASPGLDAINNNPRVGEPTYGFELRALYGIGFDLWGGTSGFASAEVAYRGRPGNSADEMRLDAAIGFRPMQDVLLMLQSFNNIGLRNARPGGADYSVAKVQASVTYELSPRWALSFGYLRDVAGRKVALGQGGIFAVWYRY